MKQKMTKKAWILTISIGVPVVVVGIVLGTMFGKQYFAPNITFDPNDILALEDDNDALYTKYKKTDASKYMNAFKPYELVNISMMKVNEHESFYTVGKGVVDAAPVTQSISSNFVKNHNQMFYENISASSLVQVAWRFYQEDDAVKVYEGKYKTDETASWNADKLTNHTKQSYNDTWGKDLTRPSIYIVSSKTVTKDEVKQEGKNIIVSIDFDPVLATARYVKQMVMTSDLSKNPTFQDVHINYTLSNSLDLLQISITEHYEVTKFGVHASAGTLTENFFYDVEKPIPALLEDAIYH